MAAERLVVIGADATGMSAASQARRRRGPDDLEIVVFERGRHTSYSACGIPYWISGQVSGADALVARTAQEHRSRGIDLRLGTEVTEIDVAGRRVRTRDADGGGEAWHRFDQLVIATGAVPVRPPVSGIDAPGVYGVQTLGDGEAVLRGLERDGVRRAVVVGGGYIGVEMAEAMLRRGLSVTLLDRGEQPMSTLDPDMGLLVRKAMEGMGIEVVTGAEARAVLTGPDGRVRAVATDTGERPADLVVLGLGVRPDTELARAAGLPLGDAGGLLTDRAQRVRGHEGIWAGGDCVEVLNLVSGALQHIALGTHANKHGLVIGANIGGDYATFPGVVGTAVSKVCDVEIARSGLKESQARAAGLRYVTAVVESTSRAGYYPGAAPMTVKMLAERGSGRLLGVQIVGREGAAKRVDVAAVALTAGMTVEQMTALDLGYAPPFSPVWDPVLVAARKAAGAVR
ncbi:MULTISPECIES: FAD-dependent oxidoreductase [Streptomycetaceae]|uniref:Flavoprotein oxidoreductase n=1 Tax=Streptantibioticus cattleyicolor (strain ATCC 35852 / DSM 46488 / JCM 4925 / NBRC 14057 / NRRL 8057) TaxID=1003195 RepID=F8JW78_STREN|nr:MULTISPECIES: FAD-dependent oxidoreductase [Streptomycetaceae]AEW93254.1 flavoprotein oxidoreductase [Streptantibioticus cattleyicolor NRRL 8057 = DSM 46488]MYS57975.1 FAD-dependent oxidoreductase [Streptomyces sp. SID5468]CCB73614.1 putative flavoprotein oxidoreductase [Streptantibioticus cattleyicolor NRRL 8057 = DSM 46488]